MLRIALALLCLIYGAGPTAAAARGEVVFRRCKICHTVVAGGANSVGPNLHGVFGRKAGSVTGFAYSPAMKKSGVVWSEDTLAKFLRDPRTFIPGTRMGFPGISNAADLTALLAYLKQVTQ